MATRFISFDCPPDLLKMIEQRAKQEGINRSVYIREAIFLELAFSGDLEATKFVVQKVGKRVKDAMVDKLGRIDFKSALDQLASD